MVTVISYAIGDVYEKELEHMIDSLQQHSPEANAVFAIGKEESSDFKFYIFRGTEQIEIRQYTLDVDPRHLKGWNRLGFIKPWVIFKGMMIALEHFDDELALWLDADARVRGRLESLDEDLDDGQIGLCKRDVDKDWNAGTIAIRINAPTVSWVLDWWKMCKPYFGMEHDDWKFNDQTVMRRLLLNGVSPTITNLGEHWCCIVPMLRGSKNNPPIVKPRLDDAIIWHWQASRGTFLDWKWPPPEHLRPK